MFAMIALRPDQSLGVTDLKGIDNFLMFCVNTLPVHRIPEIDRPINIQSIPQFSDQSTEPVHAREFNDREMKSAVVSAEFLEHQRSVGNDLITDAAIRVSRFGAGRSLGSVCWELVAIL